MDLTKRKPLVRIALFAVVFALVASFSAFVVSANPTQSEPRGTFTAPAGWEYREGDGQWRPVIGNHDANPYAGTQLNFRPAGGETVQHTIASRGAVVETANWTHNLVAETIVGAGLEISSGNSGWASIASEFNLRGAYGNTINIRRAATNDNLASVAVQVELNARPAALTATNAVYVTAEDVINITGITAPMVFAVVAVDAAAPAPNSVDWHPVVGNTIGRTATSGAGGFGRNAAAQSVWIRVAANETTSTPASLPFRVEVAANNAEAPEWGATPINFTDETITFPNVQDLQYRVITNGVAGAWTSVAANGEVNLEEEGYIDDEVDAYIEMRRNTTPPSPTSVRQTIPFRLDAPDTDAFTVTYSGIVATVTTAANIQWNNNGTATAVNPSGYTFTVDATATAQSVAVRTAPAAAQFASAWTTGEDNIAILARAAAPTLTVAANLELDDEDSDNDAITGLTGGSVWQFAASATNVEPATGEFAAITGTELTRDDDFDDLTNGGFVFIRIASVTGAPASQAVSIAVPAAMGDLAGIGISFANATFTGVPASAFISTNGTTWTALGTGTPPLIDYFGQTVQIRIGNVGGERARHIEVPARPVLVVPIISGEGATAVRSWINYHDVELLHIAQTNATPALQWRHNRTGHETPIAAATWINFSDTTALTGLITNATAPIAIRLLAKSTN